MIIIIIIIIIKTVTEMRDHTTAQKNTKEQKRKMVIKMLSPFNSTF